MTRLTKTWALAIATATIGATATIAAAEQADSPVADSQRGLTAQAAVDPAYKSAPATTTDAALSRQLKVLRAPNAPPAAAVQRSLDRNGTLQDKYGVRFALARSVPSSADGDVWVLPGAGYLCLAVKDPVDGWGETCQPNANVLKGFLTLSLGRSPGLPAGKQLIAGVVPDTTRSITVAQQGASAHTQPIRTNVYAALVSNPTGVTFTDTDGRPQRLPAFAP